MTMSDDAAFRLSLAAFKQIMHAVGDLARNLSQLEALPPHFRARATAIMVLAGLPLTRIVYEADGADACSLREELHGIALAIDPLIAAIGEYAADNFHGLSKESFVGLTKDALADVMEEIGDAGERKDESIREIEADPRGWEKAQALGVD